MDDNFHEAFFNEFLSMGLIFRDYSLYQFGLDELLLHLVFENWLGHEFVHAHSKRFILVLAVAVSRDAADPGSHAPAIQKFTDLLRARRAIHTWHAEVHHDKTVHGRATNQSPFDELHGFEAVRGHVTTQIELL